jgi:MFS family permease
MLLQTRLPGARRALALLLAINLFNYIDRTILAAMEPEIRKTFFASTDPDAMAKTGMLATAFLLSYMFAAPFFGWLADRFSRWVLVGIGVALWSLASGASGLAATFTALLVTRIFVGMGEAGYGPAAPTLLADYFPEAARGRVLACFYIAIPVGSALGYLFGGAAGAAWGWRWPFYLVTVPGLFLAMLCALLREPRTQFPPKKRVIRHQWRELWINRSYVLNTAAMTAMTFAVGGLSFWVPSYIHEFRGQPDLGRINIVFGGITVIAGLTATLLGGWTADWVKRHHPGSYFLVSGIAMFIAFPLTVAMLFTPFPYFWSLLFLVEFCLFFNTGPSNAALVNVTPPPIRAAAFAFNIFIIHALGDAISPPLIGAIADRWRMNTAFLAVSGAMAIAGLFWIWGAKFLEIDTKTVSDVTEM